MKRLLLLAVFLTPMVTRISAQTPRPALIGIAAVELRVTDLKKTASFYSGLLGYRLQPAPGDRAGTGHVMQIHVNIRQQVTLYDGLPAGEDERLLAVAFQTSDAAAMRLYLQAKNIQVPASVTKEPGGRLSFEVKDPDQHTIRFVQLPVASVNNDHNPDAISARILHAGLSIASSAKADHFYKDILGFSEIWRGGVTDSATSWINMHLPESTDYLEYMLVTGPVNRQQLGSMHHIALMVPDMQQALDLLNARAATRQLLIAAPRVGRNRRWQLNLFDPDGTRIELMEPFPIR